LTLLRAFGYVTDIVGWTVKEVELERALSIAEVLERAMPINALESIKKLQAVGMVKILLNGSEALLSDYARNSDEVAIIPIPSGG